MSSPAERTARPDAAVGPSPSTQVESLLQVHGLTKCFAGGVRANDAITFGVARGEIHALLGENGAGKSTLVKMIYGLLQPDGGSMRLGGDPFAPSRPSQARAAGVAMVFQHFSLFDSLTVAENITLGLTVADARGDLAGRIAQVSRSYGLALDPARHVGTLSVGERQRVEIVRCLLQKPRLLMMDEPTSVLTPIEAEGLFATLRRLAAEGCAILYISHKLDEIRRLCERATILRGGRVVATCRPAEETTRSLAQMMLAGGVAEGPAPGRAGAARSTTSEVTGRPARLVLDRLSIASEDPLGVSLRDISLEVGAGEIVGIAGVAGNGQGELMAALIGEMAAARADAIRVDGRSVGLVGPSARRAAGLAAVPEERLGHGAVPDMRLTENAILSTARGRAARGGFVDRGGARVLAHRIIESFSVRTRGAGAAARTLSGGNLQKFIVGRELIDRPAVFVAAQPTWGVDAGAAAAIHAELRRLAADGAAVLLVSQDLDELLALCDRVAVLAGGRLSVAAPVATLTLEEIGRRMGAVAA